ncbi:ATP-binding protein [Streptomyces iconiensis]|uniref:ATP-binding protein n=1 Tax=Streptomyces iconiensis TaxID=1384038 RepID=A0ABT6ZWT0_9ACTN|nr:ATP-binding protein [Streptomyces iconiensis]MDJ1133531.1 ATP-binding protein [Streptomyces iconiensis]
MRITQAQELRLSLDAVPLEIRKARRTVQAQLSSWGCESVADAAVLVVGELLSNVHKHAEGRCEVRVLVTNSGLFIGVSDTVMTLPRVVIASDAAEDGRGMQLVSALTEHWQSVITDCGKEVRCWMRVPGAGSGPGRQRPAPYAGFAGRRAAVLEPAVPLPLRAPARASGKPGSRRPYALAGTDFRPTALAGAVE